MLTDAGTCPAPARSCLDASSGVGLPGTVEVRAPETEVRGAVAPLPQTFASAATLLRDRCAARLHDRAYRGWVIFRFPETLDYWKLVEVQRPGSTRWDKVVSGRGPNDEYLFTADAPGTYLFRVTGKDGSGNSNFNTLSITFPHIPGLA